MSFENFILLTNITVFSSYGRDYNPSIDANTYFFSDKGKGAGYYRINSGMQTVVFRTQNFVGSIKIQGTLELFPNDNDWVDAHEEVFALDSTNPDRSATVSGKFLFIRAAYHIENGEIQEIRYNY